MYLYSIYLWSYYNMIFVRKQGKKYPGDFRFRLGSRAQVFASL